MKRVAKEEAERRGRELLFDRGRIVEEATPEKMFDSPEHDRTKSFLRSVLDET